MTIVNNIRMVSKELDWVQTPAAYYIAEGVMIIVEVAISIFTGGAGLVGKALLKYIIKTAVKGLGKSFMKHAAIHIAANLVSMALTGDDIMTNIGNIQFVPHPTSVTVPTQSPAGT